MAIAFTSQQLANIVDLRAQGEAEGNFAAMYDYIAEQIKVFMDTSQDGEQKSALYRSYLWFEGAAKANAGVGVYSALIRNYTSAQAQLRLGHPVDALTMQTASNDVAKNVANTILASHLVPTIDEISQDDAPAVGEDVFSSIPQDSARTHNAGWSGALLFSMLGSDQTWRLLSDNHSVSTVDDMRNVLFAAVSMENALREAVSSGKSEVVEYLRNLLSSGNNSPLIADLNIAISTLSATSNFLAPALAFLNHDGLVGFAAKLSTFGAEAVFNFIRSSAFGVASVSTKPVDILSDAAGVFSQIGQSNLTRSAQFFSVQDLLSHALVGNYYGNENNYRNALDSLSPIVVDGFQNDGRDVSLWSNGKASGLTTEYLTFRADMLQFTLRYAENRIPAGDSIVIPNAPSTDYFDYRVSHDALYKVHGTSDLNYSRVMFGSSNSDAMDGGSLNDALFGGEGNDYLAGGDGQDTLEGGTGFDSYVVRAGDTGIDHILDTDGLGEVQVSVGGSLMSVTGGEKIADNQWRSSDGLALYSYETDPQGFQNLRISVGTTSFIIRAFKDGDLGITLADAQLQSPSPTERVGTTDPYEYHVASAAVIDVQGKHAVYADGHTATITGGADDIVVFAGHLAGWDPSTASLNVAGGAGNDLINGSKSADSLSSGDGLNVLYGGEGDDHLTGGGGNDTLIGGQGSDVLLGGSGQDLLLAAGNELAVPQTTYQVTYKPETNQVDFIVGGALLDSGRGPDGVLVNLDAEETFSNSLFGGAGNDTVIGSLGDDLIDGGDGDDLLVTGGGADTLAGGTGNDILLHLDLSAKSVVMDGGAGNDSLYGGNQTDSLYGGEGNDSILGYGGADFLDGGSGADAIYGMDGDDTLRGGGGADYISGGAGNDWIEGEDGDDTLVGGDGDDTFVGGGFIDGGSGVNHVITQTGDKITLGNTEKSGEYVVHFAQNGPATGISIHVDYGFLHLPENNRLVATVGTSSVAFAENSEAVSFQFADGSIMSSQDIINSLSTIHALPGGAPSYGDLSGFTVGTSSDNYMVGTSGSDYLDGGSGNDTLDGGGGSDDQLQGGAGLDTFVLRANGANTTIYDDAGTTVRVSAELTPEDILVNRDYNSVTLVAPLSGTRMNFQAGANSGAQVTFANGTTWDWNALVSKSNIGSIYADSIRLDGSLGHDVELLAGDDSILGGGADTIDGGSGNDYILGSDYGSRLLGGEGSDTIHGGMAADFIDGGSGNDTLDGGPRLDIDNPVAGPDTIFGGDGDDHITGAQAVLLDGGSGNDFISSGSGGGAMLIGGTGNDRLISNGHNDTLVGGLGDDSLWDQASGGGTATTFVFDKGDGHDVLTISRTGDRANDQLIWHGVSSDDVSIFQVEDNLVMATKDSSQSISVSYYFDKGPYYNNNIGGVYFDNGASWSGDYLSAHAISSSNSEDSTRAATSLVQAMGAFGVPAGESFSSDPILDDHSAAYRLQGGLG
jgi:Ca2+-binding RTX toxin-like protein